MGGSRHISGILSEPNAPCQTCFASYGGHVTISFVGFRAIKAEKVHARYGVVFAGTSSYAQGKSLPVSSLRSPSSGPGFGGNEMVSGQESVAHRPLATTTIGRALRPTSFPPAAPRCFLGRVAAHRLPQAGPRGSAHGRRVLEHGDLRPQPWRVPLRKGLRGEGVRAVGFTMTLTRSWSPEEIEGLHQSGRNPPIIPFHDDRPRIPMRAGEASPPALSCASKLSRVCQGRCPRDEMVFFSVLGKERGEGGEVG